MPESQLQHPWPDPPPGPKGPRGTQVWTVLRTLRSGGWLRPRRIGCLLVVLVLLLYTAWWTLSSTVDGVTAMFSNDPGSITANPLEPVTPTNPPSTGPPGPDLGPGGKLFVAVQGAPGLAEPDPDWAGPALDLGSYTGFGIALLGLLTQDLGVAPEDIDFKPADTRTAVNMLTRGNANLALGGFAVTPQRGPEGGAVVPYLVSPLRLAVPQNSPVTGLDSLVGQDKVCAPRDSPIEEALAGRLSGRLETRASLGECKNRLSAGVAAIVGDEVALRGLPDIESGELRMLDDPPLGAIEYGIAVQPDDPVLRERVTAVLRTAIENDDWADLYTDYFGTPAPAPPTIR